MSTKRTVSLKRRAENSGNRSRADSSTRESVLAVDVAVAVPEAQHAAWYQILRAHGKVNQRLESRLLEARQVPLHWYDVLVTLEKASGHRLRMNELADNVVTSRSNLTRLVDRLETAGLLRRETCPDDRRGSYAVLTDEGARARLAAWPVVAQGIVELFASQVSDEEAHILIEVLRRVADSEPTQPCV
jgi:DNA-binding MarR family transcriptional regulator